VRRPAGTRAGGESPLPDPQPWLEVWSEATDQARRRSAEVRLDISYGNRESERLDLYIPHHLPRRLPFAAFVMGLRWCEPLRAAAGFPARAVHQQGAALAVLGFDASPAAERATQVGQVRRGWAFLVENAAQFGLDPQRGHLLGHGCGACLAALAAFDAEAPPARSAVLLSGLYDPASLRRAAGAAAALPGAQPGPSPLDGIHRDGPRLVVAWGEHEPEALKRQSRDFAEACRARGLRVLHGELPGRTHFGTSLELADPHSQVLASLRE